MSEPAARKSHDVWKHYFQNLKPLAITSVEAADFAERLALAIPLSPRMRVLDYGCGFGHAAQALASQVGELVLWDHAPAMLQYALELNRDHSNVRPAPWDKEHPERTPHSHFDLIIVNSVVQYKRSHELDDALVLWSRLLRPDGRLVLSDLIAPDHRGIDDWADLLRFHWRYGLMTSLPRDAWNAYRDYRKAHSTRPIQRLSEEILRDKAAAVGLRLQVLPRNLTYRSRRYSALLQPAPAAQPAEHETSGVAGRE